MQKEQLNMYEQLNASNVNMKIWIVNFWILHQDVYTDDVQYV